jgi:hypothetical protein
MIKARGTTSEVFAGESLDGIEEIIKSLAEKKKKKDEKADSDEDFDGEFPETA